MERLSAPLLAEIMRCLSPREVLLIFRVVCNSFFSVFSQPCFQAQYLLSLTHSDCSLRLNATPLQQLLTDLVKGISSELRFLGLATTGGVSGENLSYWVEEAFKIPYGRGYCSPKGQKENINVIAGLKPVVEMSAAEREARSRIASAFREFEKAVYLKEMPENGSDLTDTELICFTDFWVFERDYFLSTFTAEEAEVLSSHLDADLRLVLEPARRFTDFCRYPGNYNILVDEASLKKCASGAMLALVTKITVIRTGGYTCPIRTFVVLSSVQPIDVEDERWKVYDGLVNHQQVDELTNSVSAFPAVANTEDSEQFIVKTFTQCDLSFRPYFWVQFKPGSSEITLKLPYGMLCRYLYLKLIDPEPQLRVDNPNIDLRLVRVNGLRVPIFT